MNRTPGLLAGIACAVAVAVGGCVRAAEPDLATRFPTGACPAADAGDGAVRVLHPVLAARICRLEHSSPRLRSELGELRRGDLRVWIGTPKQVQRAETRSAIDGGRMPRRRLADFAAVHDEETGELTDLVVRIHLARVQRVLRQWARDNPRWQGTRGDFHELVDAILIHELWGHLIPVARARSVDAHCSDPLPGQPALESCVMRRENDLRREIGLRPRSRYMFSRWDR